MHLLAERFVFWAWWSCFLKEGVKTYLMAPMSPLNTQIFLCLHIYSLWLKRGLDRLNFFLPQVTAVSTALAPDSNNLERVSQSPYQHTGHQVAMQTMPDKGTHVISTNTSRKPAARTSKKKKKKDPHEPQK
jgi:hypothetical protein